MRTKNTPKGWKPPYPAWSADLSTDHSHVIIVYYGIQYKDGDYNSDSIKTFAEKMSLSLQTAHAPENVERGTFVDQQEYQNDILICYWSSLAEFNHWQNSAPLVHWLNEPERLSGNTGFWIERLVVPLNKFESNFSSPDPVGAAALTKRDMIGPIKEHAYWGSMRDRIPASLTDDFKAAEIQIDNTAVQSRGQTILLYAPDNLCVIRSGQDWTFCKEDERKSYLQDVHPVLEAGMDYLKQNPLDSGCLSCRLVTESDSNNRPVQKSFGLVYFKSMDYLEDWSKNHPTHLKIFQNFHALVQKFNFDLDLRLWHEVAILDKKTTQFQYINCHNKTGLLS
ncbi:MAG: phenylacetaldoxime dehydratase family protein [Emcibacter sp.]|nr:phenylacetaldoxime dehydratase family protein [Emcibacter sp.]